MNRDSDHRRPHPPALTNWERRDARRLAQYKRRALEEVRRRAQAAGLLPTKPEKT